VVGVVALQTGGVRLDDEQCYRAVQSRDPRFDGWFVTAVRTTGIYCRPSCPAITPKRANAEFFVTAATAQQHGYRACKRCRPDASPGSPEWSGRADVVGRAMRLIGDGVVDRDGVAGLARRLGYSTRQLNRLLVGEVGCGALALARAQRAETARLLIETTDLASTEIAFAAGFTSVRQYNDTVRDVFAASPRELRLARRPARGRSAQLVVRLPMRRPFDGAALLEFFGRRAVPGVEEVVGAPSGPVTYRRSLRLDHGNGVVSMTPGAGAVTCTLQLDAVADVQTAVHRCRRMFDLDADPQAIVDQLGADPLLAGLVAARPGLRAPGNPDGTELLVRALLGQQVSVAGARTLAGRMTAELGDPLAMPVGAVTHAFPTAAAVAGRGPHGLPMPAARARALVGACQRLADGSLVLDAGVDRADAVARLAALDGIGPWTAGYVAMRALGDPDVFLPTDLGVRHALVALGVDARPAAATALAGRWSPWRSYAVHHLWASL
jgi:AraC family transcriptional regulator of adaptative response / DNA-3-methyladenine glycosylase II